MSDRTIVYTDGACSGNPGPGGWAWVVPDGAFAAGFEQDTTNQRMELTAVIEALGRLRGPVEVISDSTYVVNCFRDGWWKGWLERGWLTTAKKAVANRDLWEPLVERVRTGDVDFRWVKGHSGDEWNDLADQLAVEAVRRRSGRSGSAPPDPIEDGGARTERPPDDPNRSTSRLDAPAGHLIVILGHRAPELGGYDDNQVAAGVRRRLTEILAAKRELDPDAVVLTGLRLGAEQLGAEAAAAALVPYVAVLPYPDPDSVWPPSAREHFRRLSEGAREVRTLQRRPPDGRAAAGQALARRDAWLARVADEAIVVWDGQDKAIGALIRSLEKALDDDVWVVDPSG